MKISATIYNSGQQHDVQVMTNDASKQLTIPPKAEGKGSSVNGGELLFLAIGTCFCNDLYREAAKRNLDIHAVQVMVSGEFGREGEPGFNIQYEARVESNCPEEEINDLILYVDSIAEVHNTLRIGTPITLKK